MHELSLCDSIHGIVVRAAAGRAVETVNLQVGQLRQVVPETLSYCWTIVTEGGELAGSRLAIESIPVVIDCADCAASTRIEESLSLLCGTCGSGRVRVLSGEEFLLTSLDLRGDAEPAPAAASAGPTREAG